MRSPVMIVSLLFAAGIAVGHADYVEGSHIYSLTILAGVMIASLLIILYRLKARWRWHLLLLAVAAFGAGWMANMATWHQRENEWATLASSPHTNHSGTVNSIRQTERTIQANVTTTDGVDIQLSIPHHLLTHLPRVGETLVFTSRLRPLLPSLRDNITSYDMHLLHSGTVATGYVTRLRVLHTQPTRLPQRLRAALTDRLHTAGLQQRSASLASALLVADRSTLDKDTQAAFRDAGAAHILALSGMHLSLLTWLLFALLGHQLRDRIRNTLIITSTVWLFVAVAGCPLSLVRAAVLLTVMMAAMLMRWRVRLFDALWSAMLLMLLCQPHALYDVGAQLSFAAMFGLAIMDWYKPHPRFAHDPRHWSLRLLSSTTQWTFHAFIASIVCTIATLPFTAYHFAHISIYSCVSSIILIPTTYLIILTAALTLCYPHPLLCTILDTLVTYQLSAAQTISHLPLAVIEW